jgi:hypothetical protein
MVISVLTTSTKILGGRVALIHFAFDDDDLPDGELLAEFFPGLGEEHEFDVALNVFDGDEAHGLAGFGGVRAHDGDETRHADFFFVAGFGELTRKIADDLRECGFDIR